MRLVAYDPFVSAERARQLGVQLVPHVERARRDRATSSRSTRRRRPRPSASSTPTCSRTPSPGMRLINAGRGGIVDEDALAAAIARRPARRRGDRHVRDRADHRVAAVRARQRRRHAAPRRVDRRRRRTRRARRSPSRSCSRCAATSCRSPSTSPRPRRPRACDRSCRSPNGSGDCSPASRAARRATLDIEYEGEIADYDCRVLTLSVLKGVLGAGRRRAGVVRERAADRGAARHRGARDEVVRRARLREPHRRARRSGHARRRRRCSASSRRRASSASTATRSTCRPRATCSSCTTTTVPA